MTKMKKIFVIVMLGLTALLTGCTGDQALPPLYKPEAMGDARLGNGLWNAPMAAYQVALGSIPTDEFGVNRTQCWVTGYIVGWVNTQISTSNIEAAADFTVPASLATNILIASRPDEKNPLNVATVQLPYGDVRNALNLLDHPENLYQQVTIYGHVGSKYCGAYGVRSVTEYAWGDQGLDLKTD